jgi:hypothetical protein
VQFAIPSNLLAADTFKVTFSFSDMKSERFDFYEDLLSVEVEESSKLTQSTAAREGIIRPHINFVTETLESYGRV